MSFSVNPGTFQSMNIETAKEKHFFLSQLSTLLTQMITQLAQNSIAAVLPINLANPAQATIPAWTVYTCTLTPGSGTITAQNSTTAYLQIGKLVFVNGRVTVTNIGTAAGSWNFNLPFASKRAFAFMIKENGVSGAIWSGSVAAGGSAVAIATSANASPVWTNNYTPTFTFSYEST